MMLSSKPKKPKKRKNRLWGGRGVDLLQAGPRGGTQSDSNDMDSEVVLFWVLCFACLSGLGLVLFRLRSVGAGWGALYLLILVVCLTGRFCDKSALIYAAGAMFFVFVLLPGL